MVHLNNSTRVKNADFQFFVMFSTWFLGNFNRVINLYLCLNLYQNTCLDWLWNCVNAYVCESLMTLIHSKQKHKYNSSYISQVLNACHSNLFEQTKTGTIFKQVHSWPQSVSQSLLSLPTHPGQIYWHGQPSVYTAEIACLKLDVTSQITNNTLVELAHGKKKRALSAEA